MYDELGIIIKKIGFKSSISKVLKDILLKTKIMTLVFLDPILDLYRQKLHMDIKIFIDTTLNFRAQIMSQALIDLVLAPNSS